MEGQYLTQNDIAAMRTRGVDLGPRWRPILEEVVSKTGFLPERKLLRKSEWWKTGKIGAVHSPGILLKNGEEIRVVLKIQGTKPPTSEALMIEAFAKQNKSRIIRPPKVFKYLPWDEEKQYEAIILEEVQGLPVISKHPAPDRELDAFFDLYEEYRRNCRNAPWVIKPQVYSYQEHLSKWLAAVEEQAKGDTLKYPEDGELARKAVEIIERNLLIRHLEFAHGHFHPGDLIVTKSGEIVLFSNLFWGWKNPFYDAVFSYHWWMLGMEHAKNLTPELLERGRNQWLTKIYHLSEVKGNNANKRWVTLALLERAVPAFMVDRFMMDQTKPSAQIITEATRQELKRLIEELK